MQQKSGLCKGLFSFFICKKTKLPWCWPFVYARSISVSFLGLAFWCNQRAYNGQHTQTNKHNEIVARANRSVGRPQNYINKSTAWRGKHIFFYLRLCFCCCWNYNFFFLIFVYDKHKPLRYAARRLAFKLSHISTKMKIIKKKETNQN